MEVVRRVKLEDGLTLQSLVGIATGQVVIVFHGQRGSNLKWPLRCPRKGGHPTMRIQQLSEVHSLWYLAQAVAPYRPIPATTAEARKNAANKTLNFVMTCSPNLATQSPKLVKSISYPSERRK